MKKHNFSAGPSILASEVLERVAKAVEQLDDIGLSLIEISHRSKEFISIMEKAQGLALELAGLDGKGYKALFLQGGASLQFLMTAYNFLNTKAGYINTGTWSTKAIAEAKSFGEIAEVASSKDANYNYIPKNISIPEGLDYLHLTTNNTIFGTQFYDFPSTETPLIADMSSDIFSREMDYSKFDLIYAGAQKNIGPAGATLVILKEDILNKIEREVPSMLNYKKHLAQGSMFNTPPVFSIYTSMLTFEWIQNKGGLKGIGKMNEEKATLLYNEIDRNKAFVGFAKKEDRSQMNVTFNLSEGIDGGAFDSLWNEVGISGIKGHRSVGGYRASIYNALPLSSVQKLIEVMQKFEKTI